jgi:endonuclease/exonuclease/phosphatase (EEP) superfamily protein YafD
MSSSKQWYVRIFDYPRLQTFIIANIVLVWFLSFYFRKNKLHYLLLVLLLVVIYIQGYKAMPYTVFGKKQVLTATDSSGNTISLLISNVLQKNKAYQKLLDKVEGYQPDLLVTTETDSTWQEALKVIEGSYPYQVPVPLNNTYGMHLYSKLPLKDPSVQFLVEQEIPSIKAKVQLRSGDWISIYIVHPRPPVPNETDDSKERDAEIVLVGRDARKQQGGVIVAGDFNDVAWSETTSLFQEVSGLLDPRRGRNFYNTYHAKFPLFRWPLDHIFHSTHFKLVTLERVGPINSDHFPMYVKLSYDVKAVQEQPKVKKQADTDANAQKTIQKGLNDKDD